MRNLKKLGNNPMKKNSSSSKGVQVLTQHIGISASKARRIIDQIRGRSYEETLMILKFMPYQASSLIFKLVYSAARNANHNMGLNNAELFISKAEVNRSTIRKKTRFCAKGHSYPIKRITCLITIVLKEKSKSLLDESKI